MNTKILVVFDLDGTLADVSHRMHYIQKDPNNKKKKRRYDLFHAACVHDGVIDKVANIYRNFVNNPHIVVVVLSGRDASQFENTVKWFSENDLPLPDEIILKSGDQSVPDVVQKRDAADKIEKKYGVPIGMVFEDRPRVIDMWKSRGTFVVDVTQAI